MTSEELLRLLRSHWTTVVTGLDDDDLDRVSGALRELREETAAGDPVAVARAVRRLKRTLAALPPGHPVSEAVGGHRYAAATRELPGLGTIDAVISVLGTDSAALLRTARRRLLAAPALTEAERAALTGTEHARPAGTERAEPAGAERAEQAGTERAEPPGAGHAAPPDAGLIRLRDPDRGIRYPRFQFRPGTAEPLPVVRRINTLLRADRDPWGAADWWLGGNRWLGGVPADLLGVLPDEALERAAAELVGAL
ncbi:hypothetical protein [Streptomyces cinerochromogenes]|uniref:hypothetical protein n=1 Tax=Streptomyces cinerochromogenes TaxID=66422 RepID=UPI0016718945|nr:hypothetical protein [Streptomyces cinerochromogenes]GGS90901.1 hypothetical protein GCM10010206_62030 [Streptomyces cinerochromogenes]